MGNPRLLSLCFVHCFHRGAALFVRLNLLLSNLFQKACSPKNKTKKGIFPVIIKQRTGGCTSIVDFVIGLAKTKQNTLALFA